MSPLLLAAPCSETLLFETRQLSDLQVKIGCEQKPVPHTQWWGWAWGKVGLCVPQCGARQMPQWGWAWGSACYSGAKHGAVNTSKLVFGQMQKCCWS